MYIKRLALRSIYLFFFLLFCTSGIFAQNAYNIAVDSVKVLRIQGSIKCGQIHNMVIYWKITSSNTSADYPTCASPAYLQASIAGGTFPNVAGGYSNKLTWEMYDGDFYGIQESNIPIGSYRDTLKIRTPNSVGDIFTCATAVTPSSGIKNPDCPVNTLTNTVGGLDDYKFRNDTVSSCTALPISLKSFTVEKRDGENVLTWESIIENNFANYNVEHATNAIDFNEVANQPGTGNGSRYKFLHTSPALGLNYYRLKMVDLDGSYVYSDVKVVDFSSERSKQLNVYPNPFSQVFTIENLQTPSDITVFDMTGKLIRQMSVTDNNVLMDLSQHPSGIYSVNIKDKLDTKVFRMIKSE